MSPNNLISTGADLGFPRSRGDEPQILIMSQYPHAFSPLTRG